MQDTFLSRHVLIDMTHIDLGQHNFTELSPLVGYRTGQTVLVDASVRVHRVSPPWRSKVDLWLIYLDVSYTRLTLNPAENGRATEEVRS